MIARAEMSTNAHVAEPQSSSGPKGMAVALIGPNDAHRQTVARALASADGRKVHEFIDYPATLNDLARMMETKFDVVLVDVDTDESYALQIISKLAELGPAVMAYSARTDEDLLKSCMRAGARDFLPLPSEGGSAPASVAPKPAPVAPRPLPRVTVPQPAARQTPATVQVTSQSNVTPIAPEKRIEPVVEAQPTRAPEMRTIPDILKDTEKSKASSDSESAKAADESDFAAWDAANLRRASMPPVPKPDARPRPSLVPEKRKAPEPAQVPAKVEEPEPVAEAAPAPAPIMPAIERPPVSADIFRSSMFQAEPSEAAEKQGANVMKWILIAAGPVVLALVLLVVFTRTSPSASSAANAKQTAVAPTPATSPSQSPDPTANDRLIVNATGKTGNSQSSISKPSAAQPQEPTAAPETSDPAPVSPDAMAAQLVAPTRIAGQIKKTAPVEEAPPSAPSSVSLEDNNSVPGSVFGSGQRTKVIPHVVPISAGVAAGMIVHKTSPVYPKFAQDAHITGTVVLKATITKQGAIEGIQVLSGPKLLAPSAVDAVKTWKYKPYMLDGQPVAVETNVTVVFGGKA